MLYPLALPRKRRSSNSTLYTNSSSTIVLASEPSPGSFHSALIIYQIKRALLEKKKRFPSLKVGPPFHTILDCSGHCKAKADCFAFRFDHVSKTCFRHENQTRLSLMSPALEAPAFSVMISASHLKECMNECYF